MNKITLSCSCGYAASGVSLVAANDGLIDHWTAVGERKGHVIVFPEK